MKGGMTCREVAALVGPAMDGRLPEARARAVIAHAERCRRCGLIIAAERRIAAAVAAESAPRAPELLAARVMARVYREALGGVRGGAERARARENYRRIGLGFVLSGALIAALLMAPSGLLPAVMQPAGVAAALRGGRESAVRIALEGAGALVRGALRAPAEPTPPMEGGRSR